MNNNSKVCVNKSVGISTLVVLVVLTGIYVFNNLANTKVSYKSKAAEPQTTAGIVGGASAYLAKLDQTTGYAYVTTNISDVVAYVVQAPKNWQDAQAWSVFVPWMGKDPQKPDAPGGACFIKLTSTSNSIRLPFEYTNGFRVTSATQVSNQVVADGSEKCIFDEKTANTLIVHSGKIIGVIAPPPYVQEKLDEQLRVSVPWHSQGRPNNFDVPIGSFNVSVHSSTGVESTYTGSLNMGYQVSVSTATSGTATYNAL